MTISRKLFLGTAAASAMLATTPASAITFILNDTGGAGVGSQARLGFEIAAAYWSSVLTNDSVVRLDIGFRALAPGVLGQAGSTRADVNLTRIADRLGATGTSALDAQALASLLPQIDSNGAIAAITQGPGPNGLGISPDVLEYDNDGSQNNRFIWGNTSVLKAMGITTDDFTGNDFSTSRDGQISFNSNFNFDFNPTDGITTGSFDFIGVAIHEIGHTLGFVSGVDIYDGNQQFDYDNPGGGLMSVLDLFRYSADVLDVAPGDGAALDWSISRPSTIALGGNSYFSIDGGETQLFGDSRFATGRNFGDGQQASHWKDKGGCSGQIGIMDPNFCNAQLGIIEAEDLAAFDAMGWNINFDVLANSGYAFTTSQAYNQFFQNAIPEPASWAMMISGFGLIGGALRRSNLRKASYSVA